MRHPGDPPVSRRWGRPQRGAPEPLFQPLCATGAMMGLDTAPVRLAHCLTHANALPMFPLLI